MTKLAISTLAAVAVLFASSGYSDAGHRRPHSDRSEAPKVKVVTAGACAPGREPKATNDCKTTSFGTRCRNECVWADEAK